MAVDDAGPRTRTEAATGCKNGPRVIDTIWADVDAKLAET